MTKRGPGTGTRTLKLTIAYDGTRYAGWQIQTRNTQTPTIQGTLQKVLKTILHEDVRVIGSGRTDAGVHAEAQVAHVRTRSMIETKTLRKAANHLLPSDIVVTSIEEALRGFHAQYAAKRKRYRYRIFLGDAPPPFIRPYVHRVHAPLNLAAMRREAAAAKGAHDFRAFAREEGKTLRSTRRTIYGIALIRRGKELHLEVEGNGFLHTMVRSLAGTVMDVGRGRLPRGIVRRMLREGQRSLAGATAPAKGLTLVCVGYDD
ncbi:MAG: tRNA pseudouridine(38-40) synthase TruA [Candidatus Omnitrophica bacterium]|nr:tRNA pseudouridine(38-40) synthase TruA [Candidatus Omnitrophota bacterium]